jgi:hypothetical protein
MVQRRLTALVLCIAAWGQVRAEDDPLPKIPATGLLLPAATRGGRSPIVADAVEALRLGGSPLAVKEGDEVKLADGSVRKWI